MKVYKYFKTKILRTIPLVIFLVIFCLSFAQGIETLQNHRDLKKYKKDSAKLFFIEDAYRRSEMEKFVDAVWNGYVKKMLKNKEIEMFNISKENIILILVDLNKDGEKDILASVANNDYFCGKSGQDCELVAFISLKTHDYLKVESCVSVSWEKFPVYILDSVSNGLRDIVVNDKFLLRFDGKEYCYRN